MQGDQGKENKTAKFLWPPTEDDLRHLYLNQKLSAMKISRLYGLKYPNPKSGESMVLYYLKRFDIKRRDSAEHIRKVTAKMVDEWVQRYEKGESLKGIAGGEVSPVTVLLHLRKRGVQLRDKIGALIETLTKHPKTPFSGDPMEKAYLMGFALGDLHVMRHGRAIRVKTGTTHPAMARLFEELFKYGPVYRYPRKAKWTGYEWSLDADLDHSFELLLEAGPSIVRTFSNDRRMFLSFLAGFFDAEGSIYLHAKTSGFAPELVITNSNHALIRSLADELQRLGFFCVTQYTRQKAGRFGVRVAGDIWRIMIWRFNDVQKLLKELPLRHAERVEKARLALDITQPLCSIHSRQVVKKWDELQATLKEERRQFLDEARTMLQEKARILANKSN